MARRTLFLLASLAALISFGCSSKVTNPPAASSARTYNGTASVGDFLSLSIDAATHTLHYVNHSNGDSATAAYTVNGDGTYAIADPGGNLVTAYEVPNFILLVQAAKTGPTHDQKSLITAVQSSPISVSSISNRHFNYMQFRTAAGGVEVGSVVTDAGGQVTNSSYWPFGAQNGSSPFNSGLVTTNVFVPDASGTFMRLPDGSGGNNYVFGTPNGVFAVDTQNGAILGLEQAASKDFNPANAGTYKAIYYEKTGASTGAGNVESGTANLGTGSLNFSAAGVMTILDQAGSVVGTGTLVPVADAPYLYGSPGLLDDPCHGLFTVRIASVSSQQDMFVTFINGAVLFSSYQTALPMKGGNTYNYVYGTALK